MIGLPLFYAFKRERVVRVLGAFLTNVDAGQDLL